MGQGEEGRHGRGGGMRGTVEGREGRGRRGVKGGGGGGNAPPGQRWGGRGECACEERGRGRTRRGGSPEIGAVGRGGPEIGEFWKIKRLLGQCPACEATRFSPPKIY